MQKIWPCLYLCLLLAWPASAARNVILIIGDGMDDQVLVAITVRNLMAL